MVMASCATVPEKTPADYVNPIIGATTFDEFKGSFHGLGKTFPGVCTPFGLVQLSPDTKTGGDNGSGYSWHHKTIEGNICHRKLGHLDHMPARGHDAEDSPLLQFRDRRSGAGTDLPGFIGKQGTIHVKKRSFDHFIPPAGTPHGRPYPAPRR